MKAHFATIIIFTSIFLSGATAQNFGERIDMGTIESDLITEASGIAASRKNPGVFWTHNDSGGKNRIFAFNSKGKHLGTYTIAMIQNRDWEDIAVGPGPVEGEQYIYIADIGDNSIRYNVKYIYRIVEPCVSPHQTPIDTALYGAEKLPFQYVDGNHNAETLMIDPLTLDIFIASKENLTKVYGVPWPYDFYSAPTLNVDTLDIATGILFDTAVGGDISPDGREILIKKKNVIYYWQRDEDQTVAEALKNPLFTFPYVKEPQGEAVCWAHDVSGYYTISEGLHPHLYFYPRLTNSVSSEANHAINFSLSQNYPNPFNPATVIRYNIAEPERVTISVYNTLGRRVAVLLNAFQNRGAHSIIFNGENLPGGLYLYKIKCKNYSAVKKMLLIK